MGEQPQWCLIVSSLWPLRSTTSSPPPTPAQILHHSESCDLPTTRTRWAALSQPAAHRRAKGRRGRLLPGAHADRAMSTGCWQGMARGHQGRQSPASCPGNCALCSALAPWHQSCGWPGALHPPIPRDPSLLLPLQHTHAHTGAHTHTQTTHICTLMHSHMHTCNYTHMHTHTHTHSHNTVASWQSPRPNYTGLKAKAQMAVSDADADTESGGWESQVARACDARTGAGLSGQRCAEAELSEHLSSPASLSGPAPPLPPAPRSAPTLLGSCNQ